MVRGGSIFYTVLAVVAFLLVVLDQITKNYIDSKYDKYEMVHIYKKLYFVKMYNQGAAYGMLKNKKKLLIGASFLAICTMIYMMVYMVPEEKGIHIGLIVMIAGAVGNLYDRIKHGYVIDFLYIKSKMKKAPIFNVADITILVGVLIVLVYDIAILI